MHILEDVTRNPFLSGNRAPIRQERDFTELEVVGELPKELSGYFLRTGPNPQFDPIGMYHIFDGDGMLHGIHIQDGKASYRNRYVRTRGFEVEREEGKPIWKGVMHPPDFGNPRGKGKNPSNTNIIYCGREVLSLWEGGAPYAVKIPSLETKGSQRFDGKLKGGMTAHPKRDPRTGEVMFFFYSAFAPYLRYGVVSEQGELVTYEAIDIPNPSSMHDIAFTDNYSIIGDFPLKIRPELAMKGGSPMNWEPEHGMRWGILPRHGTNDDVQWIVGEPGYIYHFTNAYEDGDRIVIDGCRMGATSFALDMVGQEDFADGVDADVPRMTRFVLDRAAGTVSETQVDDINTEFPRVNPGHAGRRHRYSFNSAVKQGGEPVTFDHYVKYDMDSGTRELRELGANVRCGDTVFVPRPGATDEDDGWMMGLTHNLDTNESEFIVVNGQDFTGELQARVRFPARVPFGFHAEWFTDEMIENQK